MISILLPAYLIAIVFILYWWVDDLRYPKYARVQTDIMLFKNCHGIGDYIHSSGSWFFHIFVFVFTIYLII